MDVFVRHFNQPAYAMYAAIKRTTVTAPRIAVDRLARWRALPWHRHHGQLTISTLLGAVRTAASPSIAPAWPIRPSAQTLVKDWQAAVAVGLDRTR